MRNATRIPDEELDLHHSLAQLQIPVKRIPIVRIDNPQSMAETVTLKNLPPPGETSNMLAILPHL
jgi:hypothetical protein